MKENTFQPALPSLCIEGDWDELDGDASGFASEIMRKAKQGEINHIDARATCHALIFTGLVLAQQIRAGLESIAEAYVKK